MAVTIVDADNWDSCVERQNLLIANHILCLGYSSWRSKVMNNVENAVQKSCGDVVALHTVGQIMASLL